MDTEPRENANELRLRTILERIVNYATEQKEMALNYQFRNILKLKDEPDYDKVCYAYHHPYTFDLPVGVNEAPSGYWQLPILYWAPFITVMAILPVVYFSGQLKGTFSILLIVALSIITFMIPLLALSRVWGDKKMLQVVDKTIAITSLKIENEVLELIKTLVPNNPNMYRAICDFIDTQMNNLKSDKAKWDQQIMQKFQLPIHDFENYLNSLTLQINDLNKFKEDWDVETIEKSESLLERSYTATEAHIAELREVWDTVISEVQSIEAQKAKLSNLHAQADNLRMHVYQMQISAEKIQKLTDRKIHFEVKDRTDKTYRIIRHLDLALEEIETIKVRLNNLLSD